MDRRELLKGGARTVAAATALSAMSSITAEAQATGSKVKPNFVWYISEDNNPYIGAYGDPLAHTPNIDKLASEGILYETCYSASPVCAPSRFTLLTGKYAETCGPAQNMRAIGKMPSWIKGFPEYLRDAGYWTVNNWKRDYNVEVDLAAIWDESSIYAHWRKRPAGAPFFAQFTTLTTHESKLFPEAATKSDPSRMVVPTYLPDTPNVRKDRAHEYDNVTAMDAELGQILAQLDEDGLTDTTFVFYFADHGGALPRSKRFANDNGLHIPLIIRVPKQFSSLSPGRPGTVISSPVTNVDLPPTVLSLAGVPLPSYLDGAPMIGWRTRPRQIVFGQRGRMDERYDLQRSARDERFLYIRNYMPHRPYGQHYAYMWQERGYQDWEQKHLDGEVNAAQDAFWGEKPSEELYDLQRDPNQVENLAEHHRHSGKLNWLSSELDNHILSTNDNGFIPEESPLEGYEQSRVPGAYPLRQVLRVAETAIERDPDNLGRLVSELTDPNEVVRFWAAQGVLMLGVDGALAVQTLNERLQAESSVQVKIVVAETLARLGHTGKPVQFLAETLANNPGVRIQLQAANSLTYVGTAALPYLPIINTAAASLNEYVRGTCRYLQFVLTGTYTPKSPVYLELADPNTPNLVGNPFVDVGAH
ncbi:MAG: sulfatase [Actinobacteria bacterium]|nr:sulfatase [Actinomycetota bacterium]